MTTFALTDAVITIDENDLTGDSSSVALNATADELDSTTFGSTYRSKIGGLKTVEMTHEGFFNVAANRVDRYAFADLATTTVVQVAPTSTDGDTAYGFNGQRLDYTIGGTVGDIMSATGLVSGTSSVGLVTGKLAYRDTGNVTVGATASANACDFVSVASGDTMYIATSLLANTADTCDVVVEHDDNSSFTSATTHTTRNYTSTTSELFSLGTAGTTERYWRVTVTVGTTGDYTIPAISILRIPA